MSQKKMGKLPTIKGNPAESKYNNNGEHHLCYSKFNTFITNLNLLFMNFFNKNSLDISLIEN